MTTKEQTLEKVVYHVEELRKLLAEVLKWKETTDDAIQSIGMFIIALNSLFRASVGLAKLLRDKRESVKPS